MGRIHYSLLLAVCGLFLLHTVTGQAAVDTGAASTAATEVAAAPNIRTDVTDTVMALLNETGYSGSANDVNVQEIVAMLMNGTVPTDADLIRLGFIPQPAPAQLTTPPPYSISGSQPAVDPSISFQTGSLPTGGQPLAPSGGPAGTTGLGTFPAGGFQLGGFPSLGTPTGTQGGTSSGTGAGTGGSTDPFGGALANIGGTGGFPTFPSSLGSLGNLGGLATTPKPALGDPFSMNTIAGGTGGQFPGLGSLDPNALGPKPFPNAGPIGGLGTPGSTTDLLGPLGSTAGGMGSLPGGTGGFPSSPQTGILDSAYNQQQQQQSNGGGMMNNPMMMMMMMNPEMMDQMMSGENPMLTYLMMQQFMRRPQRRPPTPTSPVIPPGMGGLGGLSGFPGGPAGLGAGGGMPMPLPGSTPLGGGAGSIMDLVGSLGGGAMPAGGVGTGGAPPLDLSALAALAPPMGPAPAGGNPMDLIQGGMAGGAVGPSPGPTDMTPFLNMINTGAAGTLPSAAPLTDPMVGAVG